MLGGIKYRLSTRNYFKPSEKNMVGHSDLLKILEGEVRNPHRANNPKTTTDYAYFVVSNAGLPELELDIERRFKSEEIDSMFYKSQWFGQFTCESSSEIVIPNRHVIGFDNKGNVLAQPRTDCVWNGGGFFQGDKNYSTRILVSNVNLDDMLKLVRQIYSEKDILGSLDQIA
ncbi:MAG: hypothetical protein OEL87_00865 [Nanoarchaeota archaeon]|nr:hypothetical protein [Nanoarchaeota archaeon]